MKFLKKSITTKIIIHILLFTFGCILVLSSCNFARFINRYPSKTTSSYDTDYFHAKYLKYIERVAEYIQYAERGYVVDTSHVYENSYLDSILSMEDTLDSQSSSNLTESSISSVENDYSDQDSFEYYNYKLNIESTNFVYYVENLSTGKTYYSPYLDKIAEDKDKISEYLKKIGDSKAYLVLNTKSSRYVTNIDSSKGYMTSDNISWVIDCITGSLNNAKGETNNQYLVYTCLIDDLPYQDDFSTNYKVFEDLYHNYSISLYIIPTSFLIFILLFTLSAYVSGYTKKGNDPTILSIDKIDTDVFIIIIIITILLLKKLFLSTLSILIDTKFYRNLDLKVLMNYISLYPVIMIGVYSIIRRIKTNTIITNTLLYKILVKLKTLLVTFIKHRSVTYQLGIFFVLFIVVKLIATIFLFKGGNNGVFLYYLISITEYIVTGYLILKIAAQYSVILTETKKITEGDLNHKIPEEELTSSSLQKLGTYINNIGDGLSVAIDEKLKSERLKTELITNVSHDIKTPLTSIINYVDLLKKEKIDNERALSYLEILETKSWRLKTLIEDLVEASKASSGTINLNLERLNIVELIRQSAGEFEDRLSSRNLDIILNISEEPIYILADGRSTFRIIENIFSNVNKYALSGTRVYVDVVKTESKVSVSVKNISANKLNIDSNELMERFVRGDLSRNTEGSGLGLSISKSLAALQNATFDIVLDGDLFKAIVTFTTID